MNDKVTHVATFITNNMDKFVTQGSVFDLPRAGRPHKVPDDVAQQCAQSFKAGYSMGEIIDVDNGVRVESHKFYTCLADALYGDYKCDMLCATLRDCEVSPDYLLQRMKEVDHNLQFIRLDYKLELKDHHKHTRQTAAEFMLRHCTQDPTFLERICWVDEWHCWCTPQGRCIKVWADAHDERVRDVLPIKQLKKGEKPVAIRVLAVVNARLGCVCWEYTTGTTGLERKLIQRDDEHNPYIVSVNQTLLCTWLLTTGFT